MLPLLLLAAALPQQRPSDRLPPANPLPIATDDGATEVLAPVQAMFRALAARDAAGILAQVRPEGAATSVSDRGIRRVSWAEFAAGIKPGAERFEERLTDPAVEVDGDIAMVWSPYEFRIDGRPDHCGTDHFDLVREGGRWRILNVTWTQRPC